MDSSSIFSKQNRYRKEIANSTINEEDKQIIIGVIKRVSTDMQVLEGDSLEMQNELAEEHANQIGGIIYKSYVEEGLSAYKKRINQRPVMQSIMQDIRDGKINYVVAYKRDRMFRNNIEHMQFLQLLADHNCDIYFTARGEMQVDLSAFKVAGASKMMETMLSMWAEMDSAQTSSRVSDTMISKAHKGERTGGRLPVGYQFDEDNNIVPIEGSQEVIELVEELYLNGYGVKSIAKWLNGGEVKGLNTLSTPIPKPTIYPKSKEWNQRNIKTILFNPIYTGHISYQSKKVVELDRIVRKGTNITPMRTVERQQQIFELQTKKTDENKPPRAYNTPFILSGLIYCGECGELLKTQTSQHADGTRYSYYKCKNRYTDKATRCEMSRIYRKEILEKLILEVTKEKLKELLNSDVYEIFRKKSEDDKKFVDSHIDLVANKIKQLNKDLKEYTTMIVRLGDNEELKKVYLNEQTEVLRELNELKETHSKLIEEIEKDEEDQYNFEKFIKLAKEFSQIFDTVSVGFQKQILENLLESIHIDNNGDIRLEFKVGVIKKQTTERIVEPLKKKGESSKIPSFISFKTIGDWREPKDINGDTLVKSIVIKHNDDYTTTFNYFDTVTKMYEIIRICFYPFLCKIDPCFDIRNTHLINEEELVNYKPAQVAKNKDTHKLTTYISQKLNVSRPTARNITFGHLPQYKNFERYLEILGSDVDEFLAYVKTRYSDFFVTKDVFREIEASVNSKSIKIKLLFDGLIYCGTCGNEYEGRMERKSRKYFCVKNRIYNPNRCYSKIIMEQALIEQFEEETGCKVSRELLVQKVDKIKVDEDGTIIFEYK